MAVDDAVQNWLGQLPFKLKRELAVTVKEQADRLADAIKARTPVKTGALRDSVQVRRRRNELDFVVTAGGDATTKFYDRSTDYVREVVIDGRNNQGIARAPKGTAEGVSYDYAMATEFGTAKQGAEPFFYNTAREMMPEIRQTIDDKVADVLSKA